MDVSTAIKNGADELLLSDRPQLTNSKQNGWTEESTGGRINRLHLKMTYTTKTWYIVCDELILP